MTLYASYPADMETMLKEVVEVSEAVGMCLGVDKFAMLKGKPEGHREYSIPGGAFIRTLSEDHWYRYMYLEWCN